MLKSSILGKEMFKKIVLILLLICVNIFAQDDLQAKIAKLQTLPKLERFKLMNEIKRDLVKLNSQQRATAIGRLRASMRGKNSKMMQNENKNGLHRQMRKMQHLNENRQNNQEIRYKNQVGKNGNNPHQKPQNRPENGNKKH